MALGKSPLTSIENTPHNSASKAVTTAQPTFIWDSCFITGILEVDDQHKQLVELINAFGEHITQHGEEAPNVHDEIFTSLARYAEKHFAEEEQMMTEVGIDARHYYAHHGEHQRFLNDVNELYRKANNKQRTETNTKLLSFLIHWLAYHILGEDQLMAKQVRLINNGLTPADAFEKVEELQENATEPLLRALNGLFKQVSERNRELLELNHTLEQKVEERTQALQKINCELDELAHTDQLTGLPNRRRAMQQLESFWVSSSKTRQPLTTMMIDADKFKEVNDQFGHDAGDKVLMTLSKQLKNAFRNDDIVARLGGDEFMVILPNTPLAGALKIAEQVRAEIAELTIRAGNGIWQGSISIGVAEKTEAMEKYDVLVKAADDAVYQAKQLGRNRVSGDSL